MNRWYQSQVPPTRTPVDLKASPTVLVPSHALFTLALRQVTQPLLQVGHPLLHFKDAFLKNRYTIHGSSP